MSAAVCGSKRSFFEDIPSPPSASSSKKLRRCSPSSPSSVRLSPSPSALNHLQSIFPHMDPQLLEQALLECGNDIDTAIKKLEDLCLGAAEARGGKTCTVEELGTTAEQGILTNNGEAAAAAAAAVTIQNPSASENMPADGAEWVDLFVREMMSATSVDDAKSHVSKLLAVLENSISKCVAEETENLMLKGQIEAMIQENIVLKRAVAIQHERQKEYQDKNQELEHLKQLVSQYQEQMRTLEVNNYALMMHLRQAQESNSIPGRFNPDVF
ncbi:putative transaldolase [Gossypium arboreum]|uniref:Putative transaldolase n=1 Tax=Gossypium arboreum TaxID=29729 RepID=A0A0B0MKC5_GOSAR|nr:putative transaldolase [Gossypium arboreum]